MTHELSDQQRLLKDFLYRANELSKRQLLINGIPKIAFAIGDEGNDLNLPNEEYFRSMLMDLRVLTSENEPIQFYKIYNIVYQLIKNDESTEKHLKGIRAKYSNCLKRPPWTLGFFIPESDPENFLKLWLNAPGATYFHADRDRQKDFEKLKKEVGEKGARYALHVIAYELVRCIFDLKQFIESELYYLVDD